MSVHRTVRREMKRLAMFVSLTKSHGRAARLLQCWLLLAFGVYLSSTFFPGLEPLSQQIIVVSEQRMNRQQAYQRADADYKRAVQLKATTQATQQSDPLELERQISNYLDEFSRVDTDLGVVTRRLQELEVARAICLVGTSGGAVLALAMGIRVLRTFHEPSAAAIRLKPTRADIP